MGKRILVVEDDPNVREVVLCLLRHAGYEAEEAEDGLQALARLEEESFDVIVTDLKMPRLDGVGLLEAIRQAGKRLPVVVHSSAVDVAMRGFLDRAGAFAVVTKGGALGELVRAVKEASAASPRLAAGYA